MEMPLKYKYTRGYAPGTYEWAPRFNKHSDNNAPSTRRKLSGARLAEAQAATARGKMIRHLRADGKVRMERP